MANPYPLAVKRYQNPVMRAAIKKDPLGQLTKIMDLENLAGEIRAAGNSAFVAMCGVALYRQLQRDEQTDVLQRIQNLIASGYRRLGGRLQGMIAINIAQPEWSLWSMNGEELTAMAETNKEIKEFIDNSGLSLDFSKIAIGSFVYSMSKDGVRIAALEWSGGKAVAEAASKHMSAGAARNLGSAYIVTLAIGTVMLDLAEYDLKRTGVELKDRQAPAL